MKFPLLFSNFADSRAGSRMYFPLLVSRPWASARAASRGVTSRFTESSLKEGVGVSGKTSGHGKILQVRSWEISVVHSLGTNEEFLELGLLVSTHVPRQLTVRRRAKRKTMKTQRWCWLRKPLFNFVSRFKGFV